MFNALNFNTTAVALRVRYAVKHERPNSFEKDVHTAIGWTCISFKKIMELTIQSFGLLMVNVYLKCYFSSLTSLSCILNVQTNFHLVPLFDVVILMFLKPVAHRQG